VIGIASGTSIPERFEAIALEHLEREALRSPDSSLTYRAARELVHSVAHAVLETGALPGDRVALLFGHRPHAVVTLIGVAMSGAIAVPISTSAPADRRQQIVNDAEPVCIVTDTEHADDARALGTGRLTVINVDELAPAADRAWPRLAMDDPAFILYTSGSTGRPKGVVLTHRSVLRKIESTQSVLHTTPADRFLMVSSFAVGQGFTAMFGALLYGATLCPLDVRRLGFDRLARWLVDERISIYISSATLFRSLVRTLGDLKCPDLRLVRLGSERVTTYEVEAFRRLFPSHARLLIAYSSTETSTITGHLVGPDEEFPAGVVPVGRPTHGLSVSVVDEAGQPLAPGLEGEIVVQSAALPLGYWRDPEYTARVYRPSPDVPGERSYRTGDLGRIRPDGLLEHLGRRDRRVKVRGFRVELEEIETVLSRHPAVARVAVVAHADERGDATLVAYLELEQDSRSSIDDIRSFAAGQLPDFVVPTTFVVLDALPVTDAGKVVLSRLPEPPRERSTFGAAFEAPRTELERMVASAWKEVLDLETIGVHDPFLMIGGDSLRAAQIASRVSAASGVDVQLWELLEMSTISRLAELVARKTARESFT
jgi:amino acid adenylation domain-containing protein